MDLVSIYCVCQDPLLSAVQVVIFIIVLVQETHIHNYYLEKEKAVLDMKCYSCPFNLFEALSNLCCLGISFDYSDDSNVLSIERQFLLYPYCNCLPFHHVAHPLRSNHSLDYHEHQETEKKSEMHDCRYTC